MALIDDLIWALQYNKFVNGSGLAMMVGRKGLYVPDTNTIYYDPSEIDDERDLHLTILHELLHFLDEDGKSDKAIERWAERLYKRRNVKEVIKRYLYL